MALVRESCVPLAFLTTKVVHEADNGYVVYRQESEEDNVYFNVNKRDGDEESLVASYRVGNRPEDEEKRRAEMMANAYSQIEN